MTEQQTDRPLVLVADDEQDIRDLVAHRLGRSGYEVMSAANGEEALNLARERTPAIAILDVMMPKMNGYEVTRALRAGAETKDVAVILLSASVQESDVSEGFDAGANDYLKKPFSPQELKARVQAVLGRR